MLKRLLIISPAAPPAISGAPLMAYNLLRYFPKDSFAILTSHFGLDDDKIKNGPKLNAKHFFFDTPSLTAQPMKERHFFLRFKRSVRRIGWLRAFFHFLSVFYLSFNIVKRGRKIIREENIEELFAYSDHGPVLFSAYLLHRLTKKPFSLHFYDLYYGNNFLWFFRIMAYYLEPRLFRSATHISVMSEALGEHYEAKYGRKITVVRNAIPIESTRKFDSLESHGQPYKIIYTGTIVWAQDGAVKNLIKAINAISKYKVVLYLYTPHDDAFLESQGLFQSERVVFAHGLPQDMPAIQNSADILFTGLSFGTSHPLLINTSSPGKTCEYMISSRPILMHAPRESYIARYAKQHGFACVVDQNDIESLKQGIERLISDKVYAEELVSNAWKTALANHNAEEVSASFQACFQG
jgi:glycosyltransferase involved in cell wall biosynthesis